MTENKSNHSHSNRAQGRIVISSGISRFEPEQDHGFHAVFERADAKMYERKHALKGGK